MSDGQSRKIECFEDLIIWQKSVEFATDIYKVTESAAMRTDFGLKDQLRRAAVSISANIAEGFERRSRAEYLNFLNIAKGSSGETRSLLEIAAKVGYLKPDELNELRERSKFLSGSISNHMKSFARSSN